MVTQNKITRRAVLRTGALSAVGLSTFASTVTAQRRGEGRGGWYVEITAVYDEGISIGMPSRVEQRDRHPDPGPRVAVSFDGPDPAEITLAPGVGRELFFTEGGTYHATARPANANPNAGGSIPVRGPNPFTIAGFEPPEPPE